jgi:hypothetical protein
VKVAITLTNGKKRDLLGVDDADDWVRSFGVRGTSLLGDWVEVVPEQGDGRPLVRAWEVVTVHIIDEEEADQPATVQP